jgi:AcrR family transcriptional regulator
MPDTASTHVNPPKQSRSQRTLERLVSASLEILADEGAAGLTVHAVVDRAGSSVGSFYARFRGKDDLLDYLGERVWDEALERWNAALASRDWSELDLAGLVEGGVGLLIDAERSRSAYLRALDRAKGGGDEAYAEFRERLVGGLGDLILRRRSELAHENAERAVRVGLSGVLGVIDGDARAGADALDRATLVAECRTLLLAYLVGTLDQDGREPVDFFEVWG